MWRNLLKVTCKEFIHSVRFLLTTSDLWENIFKLAWNVWFFYWKTGNYWQNLKFYYFKKLYFSLSCENKWYIFVVSLSECMMLCYSVHMCIWCVVMSFRLMYIRNCACRKWRHHNKIDLQPLMCLPLIYLWYNIKSVL